MTSIAQKLAVVTGGAGFIGSHLCERLVKAGYRVISLDNYFTGKKENHVAGVEYRQGHTKDIASLISETPNIIYHLGEYSRVAKSIEEPALVWDMNMAGTAGVLEFWRTQQCKLVYAGSSTKFARTRADGIEGKDLSPYTWAKAANTELVQNYASWYSVPFSIAYFYNVYGPRELSGAYGTAVEIFRQARLAGAPLPVFSPGTQRRIYTHVEDTVEALLLIGERGGGEEYGIAARDEYETIAVARLFGGVIEMKPARRTSRPGAAVDTEAIRKLGWSPKHTLAEYVAQVTSA